MPAHKSERSQELQDLLRRLRPQIVEILRLHAVDQGRAAEIVHDTFMALAVRWGRVGNRETWILGTIEARCRSLAAERLASDGGEPAKGDEPEGAGGGRRS